VETDNRPPLLEESIMATVLGRSCAAALCLLSLFTLAWPKAASAARFEESAATYSTGWSQDTSRPWSGGTASISATAGAQASFAFSGSTVTWIGALRPDTGIARVFVDGALLAEVDTFSKTEETRVPVFTVTGLSTGSHTLTIQVTGQKNPLAGTATVAVDAFDVPGALATTRQQESDSDVSTTAGWVQDNAVNTFIPGLTNNFLPNASIRNWSAGGALISSTPGARATFNFTGTAVTWIGARGTQVGIARVYLDGVLAAVVDGFAMGEQIQAVMYTASGLANVPHTLVIEATGQKNLLAQSALVAVDAFEVTRPGVRVKQTHPAVQYGAGWVQGNQDRAYSEGTAAESNTVGAQASFTFNGRGVRWIGVRGPQTGIARITLDGQVVDDIDTYAVTESLQHVDYVVTGLSSGTHTIGIEVLGKNPMSTNFWVLIDAFDVLP
jgi:alpha-amylase